MWKLIQLGTIAKLAAVLSLCATVALAQETPRVVAVNHALQHIANRLLEGYAEVVLPVTEDVDPSFWRPSISDISMIQSADLILLNGAGFATWVDRVSLPRSRLVNTSAAIEDQFIVTESITHSHGDGGEHSHEGLASYLWLYPTLAMAQADAVANALTRRELVPADEVAARLEAVRADLTALDDIAKASLRDSQSVAMIATHPRYEYFARRYGLTMSSLEWEAGAMPTEDQLADLQAQVQDTGARILIWEAEPPEAAMQAVAALGLQNVVFPPLAQPDDTLGFEDAFAQAVASIQNATAAALGN